MVISGTTHARLVAGLIAERERAGLSGSALAAILGWPQSKVSRIETGDRHPRPDVVEQWLAATGATPERTAELLAVAQSLAATAEARSWPAVYAIAGGASARHRAYAALEADAAKLTVVQPNIVPAPTQTPEFARWVMERGSAAGEELEAALEARVGRAQILHTPNKDLTYIVLESAIRRRSTPLNILRGQLDRLEYLVGLSTCRIGILPDIGTTEADVILPETPASGFYLYEFGDRPATVLIELGRLELTITDPDDVAAYREAASAYEAVTAFGDDAAAIVRRIRGTLDR